MTLAMHVDPNAWMMTLPLMLAMVWAWFCPPNHTIKALWRELVQMEAQAVAVVVGATWHEDPRIIRVQRGIYWLGIAALGVASLLSAGAYLGVVHTL